MNTITSVAGVSLTFSERANWFLQERKTILTEENVPLDSQSICNES